MTPREKAFCLVEKFMYWIHPFYTPNNGDDNSLAKECAIIAVNEIKQELIENLTNDVSTIHVIYWNKVKTEIEKL